MKKWVPLGSVVIAILLLGNVIPKPVTYFLILILVMVVLTRWDKMKALFQ